MIGNKNIDSIKLIEIIVVKFKISIFGHDLYLRNLFRRSSDGSSGRDPHHNHHLQPNPKSSIMSSSSSSPTPRMMSPELYNQLRGLQRNARDLRQEVKILRRLTQLQSMAMKDLVQDTYLKLREACISFSTSRQTDVNALNGGPGSMSAADLEQWRLAQGNSSNVKIV